MKLLKTTIYPKSSFATSIKGDSLFGQICWAVVYRFGQAKLDVLLQTYEEKPFLVVSDAFATGYVPKPTMPSQLLQENSDEKKINRKKLWLTIDELQNAHYSSARTNEEVNSSDSTYVVMHNSINYKTFTTGEKGFDPYGENETALSTKDIYLLIDEEQLSIDELKELLVLVGQMGYGKKASIGKGRFEVDKLTPVEVHTASTSYMALNLFSPQGLMCKDIYYEPFTRFGKHGAKLANKNPFKKPIILADSGAVVVFDTPLEKQYIGKAITDVSHERGTVHQGYAVVLPLKEL